MTKIPPPPTKYGPTSVGQPKPAGPMMVGRAFVPPTRQMPAPSIQPLAVTRPTAVPPGPPAPAWQPGRAVLRMESKTLSTSLKDSDFDFLADPSYKEKLTTNDTTRFNRIKGSNLACQSIAIGAVLGVAPQAVMRDLIRSARRLRRQIGRGITGSVDSINQELDDAGFDMSEEGVSGYKDYDYASETVIVSYLVANSFQDVTASCLTSKTAKGMYVGTFVGQANPGKYVVMTQGHAIGVLVPKSGSASIFDGDAGSEGGLAKSSSTKAIIAVFSHS